RYRWKFQDDFLMQAPDGTAGPIAQQVKGYVSTLVDGDREPQRGFLLHGATGTGKTLLACIMLNELILHRARSGQFLSLSRQYFQQLRDTFSEDSANYGQTWRIIDELCNLPYLVLDDLGIQRGTDWELEVLYQLIDARYGDERFTVVTTNQPLEEIRQMSDGRIYSRLSEMCLFVGMQGEDYREHLSPRR
ncbi:MAG: ATP-binding protein, partial [Gemmatimonadetes bacterium]|nr:ATP-binding protein [Gemmatimonadota bacterium]